MPECTGPADDASARYLGDDAETAGGIRDAKRLVDLLQPRIPGKDLFHRLPIHYYGATVHIQPHARHSGLAPLRFDRFADAEKGLGRFTLDDIQRELERPGRDPRPEYRAPELREDVTSIDDLEPGMELEGRVSNVANFGAFVDLGVKRDGLVHVSELSDQWIDNPREVVRVGQVVRVRVLEVDRQRGRISLSMRSPEGAVPRPAA